jgi:hypothetical protein
VTYFTGNSVNPVIGVSIRRSPILGDTTTSGVLDNLHSITQLGNNFLVSKCSHVWMSPGVDSDIVPSVESFEEDLRIPQNILSNHEMSRSDVVGLQEVNELVRWLIKGNNQLDYKSRPRGSHTGRGPSSKLDPK